MPILDLKKITSPIFGYVVTGGTWDLFHDGHKFFLRTLSRIASEIGILIYRKQPVPSDTWEVREEDPVDSPLIRKKKIENFLKLENLNARVIGIVNSVWESDFILDPKTEAFAISIKNVDIEIDRSWILSLFKKANAMRIEKGLPVGSLILCPVYTDEKGIPFSASNFIKKEKRKLAKALKIRVFQDSIFIKHGRELFKLTFSEFERLIAFYLEYYEEGEVEGYQFNFKRKIEMFRNPPLIQDLPKYFYSLWSHRRELYEFALSNFSFPLKLSRVRFWSVFKSDWTPLLNMDKVYLIKP